jgi:PAP2 superfamily protein
MLRSLCLCALVALMVAGAVPVHAARTPVEPQAGSWKTWILTSGSQLRVPPPPDRAATAAELQQLQSMAASRDDAMRASIAFWDAGAPGYRWDVLARDESFKHGTLTASAVTTRQLSYLDVAIYDATVAVWDSKYAYNRQRPSEVDATLQTAIPNPESPSYPSEYAATASAAAAVLSFFFPDETDSLNALADQAARSRVAAGVEYPSDSAAGLEIGRRVADLVLERARHDGSEIAWDGSMPDDAGLWSLDGYPAGTVPVGPTLGKLQPWVLESGSQFRPGPPPADTSEQKLAEIEEIKGFQHTFVTDSTAIFWQTTRSAWPIFAERELFESGMDRNAPRAARVQALLNLTGYDAMVGCFDAKYTYWARRPVQLDPEVRTLFATPAHPTYPSAHGCISGAQSAVLAYLFPADAANLNSAGQEAGESRITAGIHFRSDVNVGLALGRSVAAAVVDRVQRDGS